MSWKPPTHDPTRELREQLPTSGWRAAIEEVAARHVLGGGEPAPFPTGSDIVWSVGEWVVKLTAPKWRSEIENEARCLRHVEGRLGVRTPRVLATGELEGWPYVVMSRVPGRSITSLWPGLAHDERLGLAAALGRLARELHELDLLEGGGAWEPYFEDALASAPRRHATPAVPPALAAEVPGFLAAAGALDDGSRVLLHTELYGEHVLVEPRGGRWIPCACIDFADARVGPREYEFTAPVELIFHAEQGLLRAYLLAYGCGEEELGPARSERMLAWALAHRFGRLERMLRAVEPARPSSLAELARRLFDLEPAGGW